MFGEYDITFCMNFQCKHQDCRRHPINTPSDQVWLSKSDFQCDEDGSCKYYYKWRN